MAIRQVSEHLHPQARPSIILIPSAGGSLGLSRPGTSSRYFTRPCEAIDSAGGQDDDYQLEDEGIPHMKMPGG